MDEERGLIEQIIGMISSMAQQGEEIPADVESRLTDLINQYADKLEMTEPPIRGNVTPAIPPGADLVYILSGGDPQAFASYLQTVPDPELNSLARNPSQVQALFNQLHGKISIPHGEVEEGIPKAPLQSSNVYGFSYDPTSSKMFVRFNSGSVYQYENVPPAAFKAFTRFGVPAKTSGRNSYGQWWKGKSPSMGASFYEIIKNGPFPYQKVA